MSSPNPNPDDHGEELNPDSQRSEAEVLAALQADLAGSKAAALAEQLVPVIPDGGTVGRTVAPHVSRVTKIRDGLRIWAPGLITTALFVVVVSLVSVPSPLVVYGLTLVGFGWWMSAGRPAPFEAARMAFYATADACAWVKRHVTAWSIRRGRYEARRTAATVRKSA